MNKAFVREPDEPDPRCPGCGSHGESVIRATLDANLAPAESRVLSDASWYCPNPRCSVGYFDASGQSVPTAALRHKAFPKDPAAPICPCKGVAAAEIEVDAEAGERTRIRALLAYGQSPEAACPHRSPTGQPCAAELQKHFLKHFKPGANPGTGARR
ncbi:MAG: hypothetical protein NTW19_07475 [Planctomycetota bacterium]|nr:hypothetical protein [Planctomycetota bacterium]